MKKNNLATDILVNIQVKLNWLEYKVKEREIIQSRPMYLGSLLLLSAAFTGFFMLFSISMMGIDLRLIPMANGLAWFAIKCSMAWIGCGIILDCWQFYQRRKRIAALKAEMGI